MPTIEGVDLRGVFLYREIEDVYAIADYGTAHRRGERVTVAGPVPGIRSTRPA